MSLTLRLTRPIALIVLAAIPVATFGQELPRDDAAAIEFFEKKIRPLLVDNCYTCHSADTNSKGGLRVDDRNGLLQGGSGGAAIVPGDPENSLLIEAVSYSGDLKMPPKKQLTEEQVADLKRWVKEGAAWPKAAEVVDLDRPNEKYEQLRKQHWAWQPLATVTPPAVSDSAWPRDDIDRFILAKLDTQALQPVADADKVTLIRRVTFDLTGLPPTLEEVDAFVADSSADAFERVVDRLLAASTFGERWGRHWLDVARYGESTGSSRNLPYPNAWRFRDYVIKAFNTDKPYDQFIREQIAGDLLPANSTEEREEHAIATGFLALGVKDVNQRFKVRYIMDNIDEQIDTVSRSVLGLTASCARCHDHKFDPIPTKDYYALAGIFQSTDLCAGLRNKMGGGGLDYYDTSMLIVLQPGTGGAIDQAKADELTKKVEAARKEFIALRDTPEGLQPAPNGRPKRQVARNKLNRLQAELTALNDPSTGGKVAIGVRDAKQIGDTQVRLRGEAEKLGPTVPRGYLSVVPVPDVPAVNVAQSGRLELAQWLTSPHNPLTSRVFVNRVWQHLFDAGLVRSSDNFGVTGDSPSHPELLDHLAGKFVSQGWSVKKLIRSIVLSRTYQLGAEARDSNIAIDPGNRWLWRHQSRRLDAEEIRDATLAAAGKLNLSPPEASPAKDMKVQELPNNGPVARKIGNDARASLHRSVYLPLLRDLVPNSLLTFDFAEQGMVTGRRDNTTVATQALYLLNDPFVRRQSLNFAERVLQQPEIDDDSRVALAYRLILGRLPTTAEIARAKTYLGEYEAVEQANLQAATAAAQAAAERPAPPPLPAAVGTEVAAAATKKPVIIDPDEVIQVDAPIQVDVIQARDPKTAAWASFSQALLGTAEFRYLK